MKKLVIFSLLLLISAAIAAAQEPLIWTDKTDYNPLETVYISGTHFDPDSDVDIMVARPDAVVDMLSSSTDNMGTFTDVDYFLSEERAMDGDYFACASTNGEWTCTMFTDCVPCPKEVDVECNDLGKVDVTGYYACTHGRDLRIKLGSTVLTGCTQYSDDDNDGIRNEPGEWRREYIECVNKDSPMSGTLRLQIDIDPTSGTNWQTLKTESVDLTCEQPQDVPEFSTTTIVAVGAFLLAGYGVFRKEKK